MFIKFKIMGPTRPNPALVILARTWKSANRSGASYKNFLENCWNKIYENNPKETDYKYQGMSMNPNQKIPKEK